ncbi:MAG TPA: hypothetical protein VFH39_00445, partial [Candidatus Saccharimonadales bacterium]|nr:hypothetical protein [Candidatus Saccharimonadales bacterium]
MKHSNYDLYKPKKLIEDVANPSSSYFKAKDISVTPLTKLGDAYETHKARKDGRIPALSNKHKPNRLWLRDLLERRKNITVRSGGGQKRIKIRHAMQRSQRRSADSSQPSSSAPLARPVSRTAAAYAAAA